MVDLTKLKDNVEGIVGSLKTMINPAGAVPNVNPDDALGMKVAQVSTLVKQITDAQQEQVKNLAKLSDMLTGAFKDIEALRAECKAAKPPESVAAPAAAEVKEVKEEKK